MNNKGFTLVEMLATIVILGIIMGIASTSVINSINTSKNKSEKIFTDKVANLIDDYLNLYGNSLSKTKKLTTENRQYEKCEDSGCNNIHKVDVYQLKSIYLKDLVDKQIIEEDKLINPSNKKKCLQNGAKGPEIKIYKDSDYVYYYSTDLSKSSCGIKSENGIINTVPDTLKDLING